MDLMKEFTLKRIDIYALAFVCFVIGLIFGKGF